MGDHVGGVLCMTGNTIYVWHYDGKFQQDALPSQPRFGRLTARLESDFGAGGRTEEGIMTGGELNVHRRRDEAANLQACFPGLLDHHLVQILSSRTPRQAVHVLQQCFGCDLEDAKAAWNEYVLRYVDG